MIVDSSALLSILLEEDDRELFSDVLSSARQVHIGAPTRFELLMVCEGRSGSALRQEAEQLLQGFAIASVPFTGALANHALDAFTRYGKGSGSGARLNFGDCMSYAVAKGLERPLLFKGDDFARTDVTPAI